MSRIEQGRVCGDCIHFAACSSWNIGSMLNTDATHCDNYKRYVSDNSKAEIELIDSILNIRQALDVMRGAGFRISASSLCEGIRQRRFDFGIGIKHDKGGWSYYISTKKLTEFLRDWGLKVD